MTTGCHWSTFQPSIGLGTGMLRPCLLLILVYSKLLKQLCALEHQSSISKYFALSLPLLSARNEMSVTEGMNDPTATDLCVTLSITRASLKRFVAGYSSTSVTAYMSTTLFCSCLPTCMQSVQERVIQPQFPSPPVAWLKYVCEHPGCDFIKSMHAAGSLLKLCSHLL